MTLPRPHRPISCTRLPKEDVPSALSLLLRASAVRNFTQQLQNLATQAAAEGGWGYSPGQAVHLEPTCLALLALSLEDDQFRQTIAQGRGALRQAANPDGSFRMPGDREEAIWPTALVLYWQVTAAYAN